MHWKVMTVLAGGGLFLVSGTGFLCVKLFLRPRDSELDDWHFEFEDRHPSLVRYERWSRIMFAGVVIGMLLLFAVLAL